MYSFWNILQYGGKYLDEESSRPDVFALDLSEQMVLALPGMAAPMANLNTPVFREISADGCSNITLQRTAN